MRKKKTIILTIIFGFYFLTRLWNLTILPILTDEAIYLHWARIIGDDFGQRFLPLMDGKTPLFMWSAIPFLWFIPDPLIAGRLLAVLFGFGSLVGIILLTKILFSSRASVIVGALYLLTPFVFMHDRLAFVESMLLFWQIWMLVFIVWFARQPSPRSAVLIGFAFGAAFWTKPSAILFAVFLPLSIFLVPQEKRRQWFFFSWIALLVGGFSVSVLSLSPHFLTIFSRSREYTYTLAEVIRRFDQIILGNARALLLWIGVNMTWPIVVLGLASFVFGLVRRDRAIAFLFLSAGALFLALVGTGKVLYPRYTLVLAPFLLVALAGAAAAVTPRFRRPIDILLGIGVVVLFLPAFWFDAALLFKPAEAPWVRADRWQYLSSWASGYGIPETISFLQSRAKGGPITVGAEGRFGNPYDSLSIAFWNNPNVRVIAADMTSRQWPERLEDIPGDVYYVVNKSRYPIVVLPPIERVGKFVKPAVDGKTPPEELWILHRFQNEGP